ncbi:hypothetical protein PT974_05125 [Cladobotryum mycophilum]|uniref:Uncharacterized protein n=1 Tax=Cladobotryum mycophilum TaxID=491253 RepID=A0ABR0SR40_9HYPO
MLKKDGLGLVTVAIRRRTIFVMERTPRRRLHGYNHDAASSTAPQPEHRGVWTVSSHGPETGKRYDAPGSLRADGPILYSDRGLLK